jgi:hypothetical protein
MGSDILAIREPRRLRQNIERTFARRATHNLRTNSAPPPESWRLRFAELAEQCRLGVDIDTARREIDDYLRNL